MRIYVKVIARSSKNEVELTGKDEYKVRVTAPPVGGRANQAVVEELAKYFKVPKSGITIIAGKTARVKIVDLNL